MFFLQRPSFLNRRTDLHGLQHLFRAWADLYGRIRSQAGYRKPAYAHLEAEIWGFPRASGEAVRAAAETRARALGLAACEARLRDPDTLVLSLPTTLARPLPDCTLWLSYCLDEPFDGCCVSFRCTLKDTPDPGSASSGPGCTMVFTGMVQEGALLLKSVWPGGPTGTGEALYQHAAWPDQAKFVQFVDAWPDAPGVPPWAVTLPGVTGPAGTGLDRFVTWFVAPEGRDLGLFLARVGMSGGTALLFGMLAAAPVPIFLRGLLAFAAVLGLVGLLWTVGMKVWFLFMAKRLQEAGLRKVFSTSITHPPLDLTGSPGLLDPTVRKLSRDFEDAGCTHYCDFGNDPPIPGFPFARLYLLPDGCGYAVFSPMFKAGNFEAFPARPVFLLATHLEDGARLVTTNHQGGYRKPLPLPVLGKGYPEATEVETILRRHRERMEALLAAGRAALPLQPDTLLKRMAAEHEEARPLMARAGYYTWGDALREAFDILHPAYRD